MESNLDYPGGLNIIIRILKIGRRPKRLEKCGMSNAWPSVAGFFLIVVDLEYNISSKCKAQWFSIFKDYTPLKVIIK